MPAKITDFVRGYVTALSDEKYSYTAIISRLKMKGVSISKNGICNCLKISEFTEGKYANKSKKRIEIYPKKNVIRPSLVKSRQ